MDFSPKYLPFIVEIRHGFKPRDRDFLSITARAVFVKVMIAAPVIAAANTKTSDFPVPGAPCIRHGTFDVKLSNASRCSVFN